MWRLFLAALLSLGALGQFVTGHTFALYSGSVVSANNSVTAGTLNLSASPTTAVLTLSNMLPGDSLTAPITLNNTGSLDMVYALATSVTNADNKGLGGQLTMSIKSGVTTCTGAGFSASGTSVYSGPLGSPASSFPVFGNPVSRTGRVLPASQSETLCFQLQLPASSLSPFANATTTATLSFTGIQP